MTESIRPKRVVIVDADNPLAEVHGEFFWREDHERALADATDAAFRDGYARGWADASRDWSRVRFRLRRRRPRHLLRRALCMLVVVGFGVSLFAQMLR